MCRSKLLHSSVIEQPMKRAMMWFLADKFIYHQPTITLQRHDGSLVGNGLVAIMFALPEIFCVPKNLALRPIRPCEAADHRHLVFAIHRDGVMSRRARQPVAPGAFAIVEIGP